MVVLTALLLFLPVLIGSLFFTDQPTKSISKTYNVVLLDKDGKEIKTYTYSK